MPYGFLVRNGRNVNVVDENSSAANFHPSNFQLRKSGPTSGDRADYFAEPSIATIGIPTILVNSSVSTLGIDPVHDTGGVRMGHIGAYSMSIDGSPGTWNCKVVRPMEGLPSSGQSYGIQVRNAQGRLTFDSGYILATPSISRRLLSGQTIDIPNGSYVALCSWYLHWTGQWRVSGSLARTAGTTFTARHRAVGTSAPPNGTPVGTVLVFEGV